MEFTATNANAVDFADVVNNFVEMGFTHVNGQEFFTTWGAPATSWGTGTVSVRVKAKQPGKFKDFWVKPGTSVTVSK